MKEYRAAIVGTGGIAAAHVRAITAHAGRVRLVAAMDVDAERVRAFAGENDIPGVYTDLALLLERERPDLVHICSPPALHCAQTVQSLDAGAWVFCEKPLVSGLAELDLIAAAEERTGRYCECVFQWRFGSGAQHLKALIAGGEMGRLLLGQCDCLWYRPMTYFAGAPWRGKWATALGGPTTNTGIHPMDMFLWLAGDWDEVTALVATLDHPTEVEDVSLAHVRFASGAVASFANSWVSAREETRVRWDFPRATVELVCHGSYTNDQWHVAPLRGETTDDELTRWATIPADRPASHETQLAALLASMDAQTRPAVSGPEARRTLAFLSALYKSAATRQPVRQGEIAPGDPYYAHVAGRGKGPH